MVRGIRGATTIVSNDEAEIIEKTKEILLEMIKQNHLESEQVAQVLISVTEDITAAFPAKAMRLISGWEYVPVMCTREIPVPQSLPSCIRIMMTVNTDMAQRDIYHVYLHDAITLRPDLIK